MELLLSGSLAFDRIMDFPGKFEDHILPEKIHILNVCFNVNGLSEKFGGTAGNIAYTLSLLGERPRILAAAGKDFERYENWLKQLNLPISNIRRIEDEFTAGAYITTDLADNQITGFNPGAMKYSCQYDFNGSDPDQTLVTVSPGNIEDMVSHCQTCRELGIPFIADPGQAINALSGDQLIEMITGASILISNDYELEMIRKATGLDTGEILERTRTVITTLGENGSVVLNGKEDVEIPAVKAEIVKDPTGAGDAYRSGLLKGLAFGQDIATAAQMGATCASFAVQNLGTQEHRFSTEAFSERYRAAFGDDPF